MDTANCITHPDKEPIAYCLAEGVCYCSECFNLHNMHKTIAIKDFRTSQAFYSNILLIQNTSALLAKHKIVASKKFDAAESYLEKQMNLLRKYIPDSLAHCDAILGNKNKFLEAQCIELERVMDNVNKFIETNLNTVIDRAWQDLNLAIIKSICL